MNPAPDDAFAQRHQAQRAATDADQAEIVAVRLGSIVFEAGIYDDRIADSLDDYDPEVEDLEHWEKEDLVLDSAAGPILEQVIRRQELLGDAYPFVLVGNALHYRPSATGVYEFCLAICNAPTITEGEYVALPREFEQLARVLMQAYFGRCAFSLHTGWPRAPGQPTSIRDLFRLLRDATGEWHWQPEEGLPDDPDPKIAKDEGVDFVVWKGLPDARLAALFILAQCACGDNWHTKLTDVSLARLRRWFHPLSYIEPVRAFCTPFHVTDTVLRECSREAGMVLDRIRLTLVAETMAAGRVNRARLQELLDMIKRAA